MSNALNAAAAELTRAQEQIAKLQAKAGMIERYAPHLVGEPRHLIPHGKHLMVCYHLTDAAELRALFAAYPPTPGITYRGTFAGYKPEAEYTERDGRVTAHTDGVHWSVERAGFRADLRCDWFHETPAGRINVRVEFKSSTNRKWPRACAEYGENPGFGREPKLLSWGAENLPEGIAEKFRYGGGLPNTPGHVAFFFPSDYPEFRDAFVDSLCDEAK